LFRIIKEARRKNRMNQKTNQKIVKIMAITSLALLGATLVGAALILQGRITATVNVTQWVLVDGKTIATGAGTIVETINATQGFPSYSPVVHTLKLAPAADKVLVVKMESTVVDGISVWHEYELNATVDDDALYCVLNDSIAWKDFAGLSFNYFITQDGGNKWIPQCNLALRDGAGTVKYYASAGFHTAGTIGARMNVTYNKGNFTIYNLDWTVYSGDVNALKDLKFKYFVIQAGDTTIDPNPAAAKQVVWISKFAFTYRTIIGIALRPLPVPDYIRTVDFRIVYLPTTSVITGCTIETSVYLIGEAEAGFT
jgi:hypothetical protein